MYQGLMINKSKKNKMLFHNLRFGLICSLTFLLLVIFNSCSKEFLNPYDPATPADSWMPRDFRLDTLGFNTLKLTWVQDEKHIDGFRILKTVNSNSTEYNLPKDSLHFIDWVVVDTSSKDICLEVKYKISAYAANNRSNEIGNSKSVQMPIPTTSDAGEDQVITTSATTVTLHANLPGTGEVGSWAIISGNGGEFSNINSGSATFTGNSCTNYILQWSIQGACSTKTDQVSISFQEIIPANAGPDQTPNSLEVNLQGNSPQNGATGVWSISSGAGGSFSNINNPNTLFTGVWGQTYILNWELTACNSISTDEVIISFPYANPHTCGAINVHNPALSYGSINDQQGNIYKTIVIGNQEWMAEDLKTTIYRNGDNILEVSDLTQWADLSEGALCSYNNENEDCPYGKLYNWYAVSDPRNLCPVGWHLPSDNEWTILSDYLGGTSVAGGKMKNLETMYWQSSNVAATNEIGFSGLPTGYRFDDGSFDNIGRYGYWWSLSEYAPEYSWYRSLLYNSGILNRNVTNKRFGFSVRCLKD